jgi:hypothetical protein
MDLAKLTKKAQDVFNKRGGTQAAKADLDQLRDIAKRKGSMTDKAKQAAAALKDPGAKGPDRSRR